VTKRSGAEKKVSGAGVCVGEGTCTPAFFILLVEPYPLGFAHVSRPTHRQTCGGSYSVKGRVVSQGSFFHRVP